MSNTSESLAQKGYSLPVYSLFTWTNSNDRLMRELIHGFKRGRAAVLAAMLCERLAQIRAPSDGANLSFLFPHGARGYPKDHAWLLTATLAELFPGSRAFSLRPQGDARLMPDQEQKRLSLGDRSRRSFAPLNAEKISSLGARVVFVDDVITSGSTAMAAFVAAGEPLAFEVWTLAARAKDYPVLS
jgi:predicted amidophosphoribosyltransferase